MSRRATRSNESVTAPTAAAPMVPNPFTGEMPPIVINTKHTQPLGILYSTERFGNNPTKATIATYIAEMKPIVTHAATHQDLKGVSS